MAPVSNRLETGATAPSDRARARLEKHAAIWGKRPLLRDIYRGYHEAINQARGTATGIDVEIGAGHGSFAAYQPQTISCDIVPCPWLDCAADATRLPFQTASVANIIMIDVLHHVTKPAGFFDEAARVLATGGRIILIEPYVSPVSRLAWRLFHDEHLDTRVHPLADEPVAAGAGGDDPWDANIAIPRLLFWRDLDSFNRRFPSLAVIERRRFDMFVYPLSGGFERRRLLPLALVPLLRASERALSFLAPLLAFRCLVIVESKR